MLKDQTGDVVDGKVKKLTPQEEKEASYAARIVPLRKRGNLILCAITIANVAVNATVAIMLAEILDSFVLGLSAATGLIVVVGELLPQAVCQRHGLAIGAYLAWLGWALVGATFILSAPISAILDCLLGAEKGEIMSKKRLKRALD